MSQAKENKEVYQPKVFSNGDILKQQLARSRYLLFKHPSKWTVNLKERADLLFKSLSSAKTSL